MTTVRIEDLRPNKICPHARYFCERHGIDWRDFVKNGIDAERLRAIGDMQDTVERVIATAEAREAANGRS